LQTALANELTRLLTHRGVNAVAESFFATLKRELADGADWATRDEARTAAFPYIEVWYNRRRRHSALGYISPEQYEQQVLRSAA
jgi:transposase InsO family protein